MRSALAIPAITVAVLVSGGCARAPSARVEARWLDGPRPPQVALRCHVRGLKTPIQYQWKYSRDVHVVGWSAPQDEPVALVQPPEPPGAAWAECDAVGSDGKTARAQHALGPLRVTTASVAAKPGAIVLARGSGFGPARSDGDGLWLVPAWGRAVAADFACRGAEWSDGVASACVPASIASGRYELRVQAGGELAAAPAPVEVKR